MNQQNTLLYFMLLAYIMPIAFVYYKYQNSDTGTRSISSIITSTEPFIQYTSAIVPNVIQTRHFIALCMLIMAGFTVLYEYQRQRWSLITILVLLVGIFGVIFIPEQDHAHYIFAGTAFFAIIGFMLGHTFNNIDIDNNHYLHDNLRILLYAQILFMVITVIGVIQDAAIFAIEVLFLLNFAIFYLYLHFSIFQPVKN